MVGRALEICIPACNARGWYGRLTGVYAGLERRRTWKRNFRPVANDAHVWNYLYGMAIFARNLTWVPSTRAADETRTRGMHANACVSYPCGVAPASPFILDCSCSNYICGDSAIMHSIDRHHCHYSVCVCVCVCDHPICSPDMLPQLTVGSSTYMSLSRGHIEF